MSADAWLARWLPLIVQHGAGLPLFEIGCGSGQDAAVLVAAGHALVGIDLSASAIATARADVPGARFVCQDLRAPWPVGEGGTGVVIASLSLHYFAWDETLALVERVRGCLRPEGLLLCRLNSTRDIHFGASGHPAIDANCYRVDGQPKRFFDAMAVASLFERGWRVRCAEERVIARYAQPKSVWEIIAHPTVEHRSTADRQ